MATPDEAGYYKQEELLQIDYHPPKTAWMDTPVDFRPGSYIYPGKAKNLKILDLPNPRDWAVTDDDWKLPENWKQIVLEGMAERLSKYRSFKIFMDMLRPLRRLLPTSATSSSAAAIRRTCRCCGRSCCAPSTARTSPPWARCWARSPAAAS